MPASVSGLRIASAAERAVLDAAREFYRTGGENHDELMAAVQDLERGAVVEAVRTSPSCYCGTGREHVHGQGYYCKPSPTNAHRGRPTPGETT